MIRLELRFDPLNSHSDTITPRGRKGNPSFTVATTVTKYDSACPDGFHGEIQTWKSGEGGSSLHGFRYIRS